MNIKRNLVKAALILGCTIPLGITTTTYAYDETNLDTKARERAVVAGAALHDETGKSRSGGAVEDTVELDEKK